MPRRSANTADILDLIRLRDLTGGQIGTIDTACPLCGPHCRAPANRKRKVLRIWDDGILVSFKCARCEAMGWARDNRISERRTATKPAVKDDHTRTKLAQFLWSRSQPALGSPAESYLRSRLCWIASDNLRFLPARAEHPAAMIARFGDGPITGIHLTKLASDGLSKAGTDNDKIMIGPSAGQPIVVRDNPERGELVVAEGIEDAATLSLITGWSAWAAGSAGRIPAVIATALHFDRLFLAVDDDKAGRWALNRAMTLRADIVPLQLAKILAPRQRLDANAAIKEFGASALLAAIDWCEAQSRYRRGEIGFHAMQSAMAHANSVFREMTEGPD